jgi:hypothetical protein
MARTIGVSSETRTRESRTASTTSLRKIAAMIGMRI